MYNHNTIINLNWVIFSIEERGQSSVWCWRHWRAWSF